MQPRSDDDNGGAQDGVQQFIEAQEDDLPRAVLDEKPSGPFCAALVPGCEGDAIKAAVDAHGKNIKSEKTPPARAPLAKGCVKRLVGKTFSQHIRAINAKHHVLVLVAAKAEKSGPQPRLASDQRYASLISEFYSFASAMYNATSIPAADRERFAFGQIDSSKNDLPHTLRLSDPDGASLLLYGLGELGEDPKSLPAVGEAALSLAGGELVRTQLTQFLLTYLPKGDQPLVTRLMTQRASALLGQDDYGDASAAAAAAAKLAKKLLPTPKPPPPPPPPRRKKEIASKADVSAKRGQDCDVCVLVVSELEGAVNATQKELELSHEAAERKQAQIDGVQKAQTKRWLKNEYKVALAAAVEERMEKVCDDIRLYDVVCDMDATDRKDHWEGPFGKRGNSIETCGQVGKERCKALTEEHAEELSRAALDAFKEERIKENERGLEGLREDRAKV